MAASTMKIFLGVLFSCVLLSVEAGDQIRIVRHGTNVTEQALITNVISMLRSCCYPASTDRTVKVGTWYGLSHSDSFVLLHFTPPKKLTLPKPGDDDPRKITPGRVVSEVVPVDEILLPLPEDTFPPHIFVKRGTNVLSFTKYDPVALARVASEPALHTSRHYPHLPDDTSSRPKTDVPTNNASARSPTGW